MTGYFSKILTFFEYKGDVARLPYPNKDIPLKCFKEWYKKDAN